MALGSTGTFAVSGMFLGNSSKASGGGIAVFGSANVTLKASIITGNTAWGGSAYGGGLSNFSSTPVILIGTKITGNTASSEPNIHGATA